MTEVFDFSTLLGEDHYLAQRRSSLIHRADLGMLEAVAKEAEVGGNVHRGAIITPFPSSADRDYITPNKYLEGSSYKSSSRIWIPFYAVIPGFRQSYNWLRLAIESKGSHCGVKLWPYLGHFSLSELIKDRLLVETIVQHKLIVFMHIGTGREIRTRENFPNVCADPQTAISVAEKLPQINFVMAHMLRLSLPALARAAEMPNVFIETSGLTSLGVWREDGRDGLPADDAGELAKMMPSKIIKFLVEEIGLGERLLFASCWPYCNWWNSSLSYEIETIIKSDITDITVKSILFKNAQQLLGRTGIVI